MCLERQQQRVVPCGNEHGFCLGCLQTLAKEHNEQVQFSCPLCRQLVTIPVVGVSSFPERQPHRLLAIRERNTTLRSCSSVSRHRARAETHDPPVIPERRTTLTSYAALPRHRARTETPAPPVIPERRTTPNSYAAVSRHKARAVTPALPVIPERRTREDRIRGWLRQVDNRDELRNIFELIRQLFRQRERELEERDESIARQLPPQECDDIGPVSGPRSALRSRPRPTSRAAPCPLTSGTRQQTSDDLQFAEIIQIIMISVILIIINYYYFFNYY